MAANAYHAKFARSSGYHQPDAKPTIRLIARRISMRAVIGHWCCCRLVPFP